MIRVEIGQMGQALTAYALNEGTTAAQALSAQNISTEGFAVQVNGETGRENESLSDGDTVLLTGALKAGDESGSGVWASAQIL